MTHESRSQQPERERRIFHTKRAKRGGEVNFWFVAVIDMQFLLVVRIWKPSEYRRGRQQGQTLSAFVSERLAFFLKRITKNQPQLAPTGLRPVHSTQAALNSSLLRTQDLTQELERIISPAHDPANVGRCLPSDLRNGQRAVRKNGQNIVQPPEMYRVLRLHSMRLNSQVVPAKVLADVQRDFGAPTKILGSRGQFKLFNNVHVHLPAFVASASARKFHLLLAYNPTNNREPSLELLFGFYSNNQ
ncbi:hypothetical protein C8R45DRAFT_948021 [Mycena sanguinolenta]|nr:hypothetical protein C8R45DRAFT_948021 [Mycena sanguinolenta]